MLGLWKPDFETCVSKSATCVTFKLGAQAEVHAVEVNKSSVWAAICSGVSPHVLSNFLVLGLPGGVMMAADACSFDVTTVMASILGDQRSSLSPMLAYCVISMMLACCVFSTMLVYCNYSSMLALFCWIDTTHH